MPLEIYNTLTRKKELFTPLHEGRVGMYVCGPTVYSDSHIGHAKSYITFDVVRRYLRFLGYDLTYVENITDVGHLTDDADEGEDKLIKRGREIRQHPMQIAETYTRRFFEDMEQLNVLPPDIAPRATGHILEQIEMIRALIDKGFAYANDGNVYFDVTKDSEYGKLSGRKVEDQESSGRVGERTDKRNPQDFALWKKAEKGHILHWPSPWGEGFPGWHIECSAMSTKYLGQTFDIHGGGIENQFPHHECEIAQTESATGKQFVRYWMHNNMVTVDGKKMGKSLGNSSYLRDLFEQFDPMTLRFFLLQSHYRSTTEFKVDAIEAAAVGYEKLINTYNRLSQAGVEVDKPLTDTERLHPLYIQFVQEMNDDFNTPKAIAVLFDLARETNSLLESPDRSPAKLQSLKTLWSVLGENVLGVLPRRSEGGKQSQAALDAVLQKVITWRNQARIAKDFKMSDAIRDDLASAGVLLEDGKEGTKWSLK
jgi:cysteinyl-tRNA synthetase